MQKNPDFVKSVIIVEKEAITLMRKRRLIMITYVILIAFWLFVVAAIVLAVLKPDYMPVSALLIVLGGAIYLFCTNIANSVSESPKQYNTVSEIIELVPFSEGIYYKNNAEAKELVLRYSDASGEETVGYDELVIQKSSGPATAIIEYYEPKISEEFMDMKLAGKISKITLYLPES